MSSKLPHGISPQRQGVFVPGPFTVCKEPLCSVLKGRGVREVEGSMYCSALSSLDPTHRTVPVADGEAPGYVELWAEAVCFS